jgi:peptidoglycan/LPS O-acetylase OafA/YrhL
VAANKELVGPSGITPMWLPGYLDWFALGMAAAAVSAYLATLAPHEPSRWRALDDLADAGLTCWALAGAVFWIATSPVAGPRDLSPVTAWQDVTKHVLYAVTAVLFLLPGFFGDQRTGVVRHLLRTRPMQFLGEISYGVFLWHLLVLRAAFLVLDRPLFAGGAWPVFLLTLAGTVVVATASSRLLERPALRLRDLVPDRAGRATGPRQADDEGRHRDQAQGLHERRAAGVGARLVPVVDGEDGPGHGVPDPREPRQHIRPDPAAHRVRRRRDPERD